MPTENEYDVYRQYLSGEKDISSLDVPENEYDQYSSQLIRRKPLDTDYGLGIFAAFRRGLERSFAMGDVAQGDYEELAEHYRNMNQWQMAPEDVAKFEELRNTEGFWKKAGGLMKNPRLVMQVVAESLPMMAGPIAGAFGGGIAGSAAGSAVPGIGTAAGAIGGSMVGGGIGSFFTEYFNAMGDFMQEHGVNPESPEELKAAFEDDTLMAEARDFAFKRGVPIAAFDALSMGLAGRIGKPISGVVGKVTGGRRVGAGVASEIGMQAAFGGAGEAGAQLASTGEIHDELDVLLEGFAEVVPGVFEAGVSRYFDARNLKEKGLGDPDKSPLAKLAEADRSSEATYDYDEMDALLDEQEEKLALKKQEEDFAEVEKAEQALRNEQFLEMETRRDVQIERQKAEAYRRKKKEEADEITRQLNEETSGAAESSLLTAPGFEQTPGEPRTLEQKRPGSPEYKPATGGGTATTEGQLFEGEPVDVVGGQPTRDEGQILSDGTVNPAGGRPLTGALGEALRGAGVVPPEGPEPPSGGGATPVGPDVTPAEAAATEGLQVQSAMAMADRIRRDTEAQIAEEERLEREAIQQEDQLPEEEPVEDIPFEPLGPTPQVAWADERMADESYHNALDRLVSETSAKGGVTQVPDPNYQGGESDKRNDDGSYEAPEIRTSSTNPPWAQEIFREENIGRPQLIAAVEKAKAGKRLGAKQKRIVQAMLDEIDQPSEYAGQEDLETADEVIEGQTQEVVPPEGLQTDMMPEPTGRDAQVTRDQQQREREAAAPEADMGVAGDIFTGTSDESIQAAEMRAAQTDVEEQAQRITTTDEAIAYAKQQKFDDDSINTVDSVEEMDNPSSEARKLIDELMTFDPTTSAEQRNAFLDKAYKLESLYDKDLVQIVADMRYGKYVEFEEIDVSEKTTRKAGPHFTGEINLAKRPGGKYQIGTSYSWNLGDYSGAFSGFNFWGRHYDSREEALRAVLTPLQRAMENFEQKPGSDRNQTQINTAKRLAKQLQKQIDALNQPELVPTETIEEAAEEDPYQVQLGTSERIIKSRKFQQEEFRFVMESAGDLVREAVKRGYRDPTYLREKLTRIRQFLAAPEPREETYAAARERDGDLLTQLEAAHEAQPVGDYPIGKVARKIALNLVRGKFVEAQKDVDAALDVLASTTEEAPVLTGQEALNVLINAHENVNAIQYNPALKTDVRMANISEKLKSISEDSFTRKAEKDRYKRVVEQFNVLNQPEQAPPAAPPEPPGEFTLNEERFNEVGADTYERVFVPTPPIDTKNRVAIDTRLNREDSKYITPEEAEQRVTEWETHAIDQRAVGNGHNDFKDNSNKVILSFFDTTGTWANPYALAGYDVRAMDIKEGFDVMDMSVQFLEDTFGGFDGEIYGILAACPCTTFANSGTRWRKSRHENTDPVESRKIIKEMWGTKAAEAKNEDGSWRYASAHDYAIELVNQTMRAIEYYRPQFWAIENPEGRIQTSAGLPGPWRTGFQPHNFGEPYTKRTLLWGNFNDNLPTANVEPTEGSKMHLMSPSPERADLRSETPEGFSYAFFMANNFLDTDPRERTMKDYWYVEGAIDEAFRAGVTEEQIRENIELDVVYDVQDESVEGAKAELRTLIDEAQGGPTPPTTPKEPSPTPPGAPTTSGVGGKQKGPFADPDVRDDWQLPGRTGPKTRERADKMRKPPFKKKEPPKPTTSGVGTAKPFKISAVIGRAGEVAGITQVRLNRIAENFAKVGDQVMQNVTTSDDKKIRVIDRKAAYTINTSNRQDGFYVDSIDVEHLGTANTSGRLTDYKSTKVSHARNALIALDQKLKDLISQRDRAAPVESEPTATEYEEVIDSAGVRIGVQDRPDLKDDQSVYGEIPNTRGADGDPIDVFIKKQPKADWEQNGTVYIVNQFNENNEFDEHKVMLGYSNKADARRSYQRAYDTTISANKIVSMKIAEFNAWLAQPESGSKPAEEVTGQQNLYAAGKKLTNAPTNKWIDTVLKGGERKMGDVPDTLPLNMAVSEFLELQKQGWISEIPSSKAEQVVQQEAPVTLSKEEVETAIAPIEESMPGAPVTVLDNYRQAPTSVIAGMVADGMESVPALYHPPTNEIFIFADRVTSADEAIRNALHEKAHRGLRKAFGTELDPLLDSVFENANPKDVENMMTIADAYGRNMNILEDQRIIAEELIAHKAEENAPNDPVLKRAIVFIRKLLRKMGIKLEFTNEDIRGIIREAYKANERIDNIEGIMLTEEVEVTESGEVYEVEMPAADMIDAIDKRTSVIEKLRNCL